MDNITATQRSYVMSRIKRLNTKPELKLKTFLKKLGYIYQPKGIYGNPDFGDKKKKIAVFMDGCFWHGCPKHYKSPESNIKYWKLKIRRNLTRDRQVNIHLKDQGWKVIRIWEHDVKAKLQPRSLIQQSTQ